MVNHSDSGCSIYILKLKSSKYYVGKTSNIEKRMVQHFRGGGSSWTRKYPVVKLLRVYHNCDSYDEDKYTLKCMDQFGIENVRGGSYVSPVLPPEEIEGITKRIRMATDKCLHCGSPDHFAYRCRSRGKNKKPKLEPEPKVEPECEICFDKHTTDDCPHL